MALHLTLGFVLLLIQSVAITVKAHDDGYMQCENTVKKWASSSLAYEVIDDKHELRDFLFFLHVPRTGGRTFSHCFLTKLYPASQECPRSYDKLRFDPRNPECRLLFSHDDYSIMSKLPKEKTSVITILRNPIDRVFSTYEFSVEVAARFLGNSKSAASILNGTNKGAKGGTLDIWPWKYLTPWMMQDLFARHDARKLKGESQLKTNNPFDMEDVLMPLHQYINHPIARDIVHNEATFQIAGLTNNSYFAESYGVRHCVLKYQTLGEYVLQVAKRRLDEMLFVGLTENHKESATMFADVVAAHVISDHTPTNSSKDLGDDFQHAFDQTSRYAKGSFCTFSSLGGSFCNYVIRRKLSKTCEAQVNVKPHLKHRVHMHVTYFGSSTPDYKDRNVRNMKMIQFKNYEQSSLLKNISSYQLITAKLREEYDTCISPLRNTHKNKRIDSLTNIFPANFTKEARTRVPEAIIQEIESLNKLDMELFTYGKDIFAKQQARTMSSTVYIERLGSRAYSYFYTSSSWRLVCSTITALLLLLFIIFFANARRTTSKLKL